MHGLCVRSSVRIDAPAVRAAHCDIEIRWGERRIIPDAPPDGRLLSRLSFPQGGSSLTASADGYVWRVDGVCEFVVDRAVRHARVHLAPDADDEQAGLFVGSFLAKMLVLDGCCVLHASAVSLGARAVAFVGASGAGKSTVAALCCAAGARVVTDDVLRVEVSDGAGWCYGGSHELRLRPGAAEVVECLGASPNRATIDGRTAVLPGAGEGVMFRLAAFVAPRAVRDGGLKVERLRGSAALMEVVRSPRTIGWTDAWPARRDLDVLAALVASVPVYRAQLPWGAKLSSVLGQTLLDRLGFELTGSPPVRQGILSASDAERPDEC